jgi:hypothetical protein
VSIRLPRLVARAIARALVVVAAAILGISTAVVPADAADQHGLSSSHFQLATVDRMVDRDALGLYLVSLERCCGSSRSPESMHPAFNAGPSQLCLNAQNGLVVTFAGDPNSGMTPENFLRASLAGVATNTADNTSTILLRTQTQLQKKFKHAGDFGVGGNYSKANAAKFSSAMHQHMNAPGTQRIVGTYRNDPAIHYLDPSSGLNVVSDLDGNFITGFKLGAGQLQDVLTSGRLW